MGNCKRFNITTVQKEIFVGKIQKIPFRFSFLKTESEKKKVFETCRNGQTERSGSESYRIQSQEGQELGSPTDVPTFISQTSGVRQSVDLTNQGNHYLRDVQDVFTLQCVEEDRMSDILLRLDL